MCRYDRMAGEISWLRSSLLFASIELGWEVGRGRGGEGQDRTPWEGRSSRRRRMGKDDRPLQ